MSWLEGWLRRKSVTIQGSSAGAVTDYCIKIVVHYGSGTDSGEHVYLNGNCRVDFGDIRFTASDGVTLLTYWMEEKVDGDYAVFWVKIPSIPTSPNTVTIYIYYDNPDATDISNGTGTFQFYDDFEDQDISDWTLDRYSYQFVNDDPTLGSISVEIYHSAGKNIWQHLEHSLNNLPLPAEITSWIKGIEGTYTGIYLIDSSNAKTRHRYYGDDHSQYEIWHTFAYSRRDDEPTWNEWHKYKCRIFSNDAELDVDDIKNYLTVHSYNLMADLAICQFVHNSGGLSTTARSRLALIYIRKYIDPEPSIIAWGSEERLAIAYEQVLTDSITISDVYYKWANFVKAISETISLTDIIYIKVKYIRAVSETIKISDVLVKTGKYYRTLFDSITLSDILTKRSTYHKVMSESIDVSDVLVKTIKYIRQLLESIDISDIVTTITKYIRQLPETIDISDITPLQKGVFKRILESMALADVLVLRGSYIRTFYEETTLTDIIPLEKGIMKQLLDQLVLSDIITKQSTHIRLMDESVSLTDIPAPSASYIKSFTDSISLIDVSPLEKSVIKVLQEPVLLSDIIRYQTAFSRLLAESIVLSDLLSSKTAYIRALDETLSLVDVTPLEKAIFKALLDEIFLVDILERLTEYVRYFVERIEISDILEHVFSILPPVLRELRLVNEYRDKFLPCDHNDHVYNFKVTLEMLKRKYYYLKEVEELEEIVNQMRYVKENDAYTDKDHNLFVEAWSKLLEIDKKLAPELAKDVEDLVDEMRYLKVRDIYSAKYHNIFREAWKRQEKINRVLAQS